MDFYTWDSLQDAEFPAGNFLIDPYIPRSGIVFLFGPKSLGKTGLQLSWTQAIATGEPWLGLPVTKGRVLLVELDQHQSTIQPRLRKVGRRGLDAFWLAGNPLSVPNLVPKVHDAVKRAADIARPDVVFFNTLHKLTSLAIDEGQTCRLVYGWAKEMFPNAALVFIHHPKKEPPSNVHMDQDEMFSGSNAWRNDAQIALHLQRWRQKKGKALIATARLRMTGSQVCPLYKPLPLLLKDGVHWSSPVVDDLLALKDLAENTGLVGNALDREAVRLKMVGSISTARQRRLALAHFPGTREWLGMEGGVVEEGDEDGESVDDDSGE